MYGTGQVRKKASVIGDPGEDIQKSVAELLQVHKPKTDLTSIWNAVEILNKSLIRTFCERYPTACLGEVVIG